VNQIELLQGELAAVSARMKRLEVVFQSRGLTTGDSMEAERMAETMGFDIEIVYLPRNAGTKKDAKARRELARRLHTENKWTAERIARALGCSYRTAERMVA
jgi:hypothetical protein